MSKSIGETLSIGADGSRAGTAQLSKVLSQFNLIVEVRDQEKNVVFISTPEPLNGPLFAHLFTGVAQSCPYRLTDGGASPCPHYQSPADVKSCETTLLLVNKDQKKMGIMARGVMAEDEVEDRADRIAGKMTRLMEVVFSPFWKEADDMGVIVDLTIKWDLKSLPCRPEFYFGLETEGYVDIDDLDVESSMVADTDTKKSIMLIRMLSCIPWADSGHPQG